MPRVEKRVCTVHTLWNLVSYGKYKLKSIIKIHPIVWFLLTIHYIVSVLVYLLHYLFNFVRTVTKNVQLTVIFTMCRFVHVVILADELVLVDHI